MRMFETRFSFPFVAEIRNTQLFFTGAVVDWVCEMSFRACRFILCNRLIQYVSCVSLAPSLAQGVKSDISNNKKTEFLCWNFSHDSTCFSSHSQEETTRKTSYNASLGTRNGMKIFYECVAIIFSRYKMLVVFSYALRLVLVVVVNFHALSRHDSGMFFQNCVSLEELLNCRRAR